MSKVQGSYKSVILGVSQQTARDRREGQHWAQNNFVSDPVHGLARRRGSENVDELRIGGFSNNAAQTKQDTRRFKSFDFSAGGGRYTLHYRSAAKISGTAAPVCICVNRDTKKFVPVVAPISGAMMEALDAGGVSATVNVGDYVYLAGNTIQPTQTTTDFYHARPNTQQAAWWIRQGGYGKNYRLLVTVRRDSDNALRTTLAEFKTPSSSYQGVLDTSDIAYDDPDYQKKVNDRNNAYNTAATQWIGIAQEQSLPTYIAARLGAILRSHMQTDIDPSNSLFSVDITGSTVGLRYWGGEIVSIDQEDGGDDSTIHGTFLTNTGPDLLTSRHYVDHIVKIAPSDKLPSEAYYLKAVPTQAGLSGVSYPVEVTWTESAGVQVQPNQLFCAGTIKGGVFYLAGSPAELSALAGVSAPGYAASSVGDLNSQQLPAVFSNKIDYLGQFQDRLIIGTGSTLLFSRPGDYLNFFRRTVSSVVDDDPIEFYSLTGEDDTIKASQPFMQNLVLFGQRRQYIIRGQAPLTPKSINIASSSSYADAVDAYPQQSGDFVFFAKKSEGFAQLNQLQVGLVDNNPQSVDISTQTGSYLAGTPVEIKAMTSPNVVFLRTDGDANKIFVYTYYDSSNQRAFDSWSTWTWDERLGYSLGMAFNETQILIPTIRMGLDSSGAQAWFLSLDLFSTQGQLAGKPYLDSMRSWSAVSAPNANSFVNSHTVRDNMSVAFDQTTDKRFMGQEYSRAAQLVAAYPTLMGSAWVGYDIDAFTTPTNPFYRDQKGNAVANVRLTITSLAIGVSDAAGLVVEMDRASLPTKTIADWNARYVSRLSAELGKQPVADYATINVLVGREVGEFQYTLRARKWLPVTISEISYVGQLFMRGRTLI